MSARRMVRALPPKKEVEYDPAAPETCRGDLCPSKVLVLFPNLPTSTAPGPSGSCTPMAPLLSESPDPSHFRLFVHMWVWSPTKCGEWAVSRFSARSVHPPESPHGLHFLILGTTSTSSRYFASVVVLVVSTEKRSTNLRLYWRLVLIRRVLISSCNGH